MDIKPQQKYHPETGELKMQRNVVALAVLFSSAAIIGLSTPATAQVGQNTVVPAQTDSSAPPPLTKAEMSRNTIGPSVSLGNGAAIGIDSKFGISENLSLRPFIYFGNGGNNFGTALTYDINLRTTNKNTNKITPFVGGAVDIRNGNGTSLTTASLVAGAEYELTEAVQLKAAFNIPLNNAQGQTSNVTLGAGIHF
jgi:hypothetical protein